MAAHTFLFYIVGKTVVSRTRKGFDLMKCEWKEKPHVLSPWTVMSLRYGACRMFCIQLLLRLHLSAAASESASNLAVWTCLEHGAASCERVMLQVYFVVNEIIKKSITKRPSANDSGIITACSWFCSVAAFILALMLNVWFLFVFLKYCFLLLLFISI